mmetsp:Transcript_114724/g.319536  ORF Transcript_114724/g.319536 Transcript_114724/m.319536 type:complete len:205 (+) Transcript_114724:894-1508(+)
MHFSDSGWWQGASSIVSATFPATPGMNFASKKDNAAGSRAGPNSRVSPSECALFIAALLRLFTIFCFWAEAICDKSATSPASSSERACMRSVKRNLSSAATAAWERLNLAAATFSEMRSCWSTAAALSESSCVADAVLSPRLKLRSVADILSDNSSFFSSTAFWKFLMARRACKTFCAPAASMFFLKCGLFSAECGLLSAELLE